MLDLAKGEQLLTLSSSAAVQITRHEMMVMGGYDESNYGYRQTYILRVDDNGTTSIREVNAFPLPIAEGLWNSTPLVHKKIIFALQNVSTGENDCSESVRRILSFDGNSWKELS